MTSAAPRRTSFGVILLLVLALLLAGAAGAVYGLKRFPEAAQTFGLIAAAPRPSAVLQPAPAPAPTSLPQAPPAGSTDIRVATLEARLARVEGASARFEDSAVRADALLIAFAARRAVERGVALGYLESLLAERFGTNHAVAVSTVVTASRRPVRLDQLTADFAALEPRLKAAPPSDSLWQNVQAELGQLVSIRRAGQPSPRPSPTYDRAAAHLAAGQVDGALAEAMRLPGIAAAPKWVADARTYVAVQRALDEIESAALLRR